jgi:anaerobic magnesium-protoporphyrin IX monomethyl ester cyclase
MLKDQRGLGERVDCVLIYPPWTILYARAFLTNALPPLGVLSIASYLERNGFSVRVLDVHAERMSPDHLRSKLSTLRPRFVGICVLSSMLVSSHAIAKDVKRLVPDCTVVVGGVHAELFPEAMLRIPRLTLLSAGTAKSQCCRLFRVPLGKM